MDWFEVLGDVNYWAVAVSLLVSFPIGMLWYSETLFGKAWMKLEGLTKKDVEDKEKMMRGMIGTTVSTIVSATLLAMLMGTIGVEGWPDGLVFGAVIGFGFALTTLVTHDSFAQKPAILTRINGLHDIVQFAAYGAIIAEMGAFA